MDIFSKIRKHNGPLGSLQKTVEGKLAFPKFSGNISNKINFNKKEVICWSYNNYLGLASTEQIHKIDAFSQKTWGMTYPMGSRMMSGETNLHEKFETEMASYIKMDKALLLNFGYQGMISVVDTLLDSQDVVISDAQCHACIIDGIRLHKGKHYIFEHNNILDLEAQLKLAKKDIHKSNGGILVITEGVFSMSGAQGKLKEIVALKQKYNFRFLVDDAHGFGVTGANGEGTVVEQGVEKEVDLYFTTFTKSMVLFGAIIAGDKDIVNYFKYNLRSQIFSKSLPMPIVNGLVERLKLVKAADKSRSQLRTITNLLQTGLRSRNLLRSSVNSCITPVYLKMSVANAISLQMEMVESFNVFCSLILYPVVPKGVIMLRLTPTSLHTEQDVAQTLRAMDSLIPKYS